MVWGAYFLTAHGALSLAWLIAGWFGAEAALRVLVIPVVVVAILATSYTGFLFAQGLGRDLWQGPSAAVDLIAQSAAAGSASLLIAAALLGSSSDAAMPTLVWTLIGALAAHLVILVFEHVFAPSPTRHHELATQTILRGHYSRLFWGAAILGGGILPIAVLLTLGAVSPVVVAAAAFLALAGGAAWEYIWVEAGQSVPLS